MTLSNPQHRGVDLGLAELLNVVNEDCDRITTAEVEFEEWSRGMPRLTAAKPRPGRSGQVSLQWAERGIDARASRGIRHLWMSNPGRLRVELTDGAGRRTSAGLADGNWWWRRAGESEQTSDDRPPGALPPIVDPWIFHPARLIGVMKLRPTGRGERAGRDVIVAAGLPRAAGAGAEFELEFDAEFGALLAWRSYQERRCIRKVEASLIVYGEDMSDGLFVS
jgi:hypothetical protein